MNERSVMIKRVTGEGAGSVLLGERSKATMAMQCHLWALTHWPQKFWNKI